MTICDQPRDLPLADATTSEPIALQVIAPAREATADSGTSATTQRVGRDSERGPKYRLWTEIANASDLGDQQSAEVWGRVRGAIDKIRADVAPLLVEQSAGVAPNPRRAALRARRASNRAEFWAGEYATKGGTPQADAEVAWSRLLSEIAKARRVGLDTAPAWQLVRQAINGIRAELASAFGFASEQPDDEGGPR